MLNVMTLPACCLYSTIVSEYVTLLELFESRISCSKRGVYGPEKEGKRFF